MVPVCADRPTAAGKLGRLILEVVDERLDAFRRFGLVRGGLEARFRVNARWRLLPFGGMQIVV